VTQRAAVETLREIYQSRQDQEPVVSIEVFPPHSVDGDEALFETLDRLIPYQPAFVSCTYGAGGSTRARTIELCLKIQSRYSCPATAHLTCVGSPREELVEWIGQVRESGLHNIMALRGDPPEGTSRFQTVDGGLEHANELVALIRDVAPEIGIGVAAYPEVHPEAVDATSDLEHLKQKVMTGADASFTQLFYVNENFLRFREEYDRVGVGVPLVPGIMPITNFKGMVSFADMCGASVPTWLHERFAGLEDDPETRQFMAASIAIEQVETLKRDGVQEFHFYTLNRAALTYAICHALGLRPKKTNTERPIT